MTTGEIPEQNREMVLDDYKFILELVSERKIEMVRVIVLEKKQEE